uniref:Uncharacterized protein n=1 Tax=Caenorhabditis japonica TaxID=281687 RepID=A0A8R1E7I2_CAEJA
MFLLAYIKTLKNQEDSGIPELTQKVFDGDSRQQPS